MDIDNFNDIKIGHLIQIKVEESKIEMNRICNFLTSTEDKIQEMYTSKSLDSDILMRWCKLLKYDFFRIYSQHLILYSPPSNIDYNKKTKSSLPRFRKNIYTKEIIDFILEQISTNSKTTAEIMALYNIPKTTLYKWISKYGKK